MEISRLTHESSLQNRLFIILTYLGINSQDIQYSPSKSQSTSCQLWKILVGSTGFLSLLQKFFFAEDTTLIKRGYLLATCDLTTINQNSTNMQKCRKDDIYTVWRKYSSSYSVSVDVEKNLNEILCMIWVRTTGKEL